MLEIICQGKSPSEAKAKCTVVETLLALLTEKKISTDKAINLLNAIGGISVVESEVEDDD